ncbi:hypothetical protein AB4Z46_21525 [Variovorax sp. M-6]|uniref:hypothetical protein n=1 Tax=Variovorax sp. M-6 TaxID=3233041 RepID=UPI003F9CEAC6
MTIPSPTPTLDGGFQPLLDWQAAWIESLLQAQSLQLRILSASQQPLAAVNQELWDLWVAHFGGGVPLDG